MMAMVLKRWFEQLPSGYRPGHTLGCALADLRGKLDVVSQTAGRAVLAISGSDLTLVAREKVERHFQMHLVSLELELTIAAPVEAGLRIDIFNTGLLFRTGVACRVARRQRPALASLKARIEADAGLTGILNLLDFRYCRLESVSGGWQIRIEPYCGSEVVNRFPSFRRYIRMEPTQAEALRRAFKAFRRIVSDSPA